VTYIESNLSETILVAALARTAGVSYSCFHRTFRACFGFTPHVYVTLKRVEFAQTLMLTTNESLSQISLACGMTDQSHFTRIFRGLTGKTPGQWRTWRRNNFDPFNQTITTGRTPAAGGASQQNGDAGESQAERPWQKLRHRRLHGVAAKIGLNHDQ
jgi:AraC-like DNA-binding protein